MFSFSVSFAQTVPEPPDEVPACFPACSPGYLCHEGTCIQACNPSCPETERCTEERVCVSKAVGASVYVAPEPVGEGELCLLRGRNFVGSLAMLPMELDGLQFGLLGNGRALCGRVPAGTHRLTMMLGDVEHHFESEIAAGATTYLVWSAKNVQSLAPMDPVYGERLRLGLTPAKEEHLTWKQ